MRMHERNHRHGEYRSEDGNFKNCGNASDQLDAADIYVSDHDNQCEANRVVLPPTNRWEKHPNVIGEEYSIDAAEQEGRSPVPPAAEKSPEIAEARAHPAIKTTLHGHRGCEFSGDERNWYAPEEGNQ